MDGALGEETETSLEVRYGGGEGLCIDEGSSDSLKAEVASKTGGAHWGS